MVPVQGVIATAQANGLEVLSVMDYGCLSAFLLPRDRLVVEYARLPAGQNTAHDCIQAGL